MTTTSELAAMLFEPTESVDVLVDAGVFPGSDGEMFDQWSGDLARVIERTDLGRPLIAYCYHGNMSQGAADYFNRNGFTTTYSMDGGYEAWESVDPKDASG